MNRVNLSLSNKQAYWLNRLAATLLSFISDTKYFILIGLFKQWMLLL